MLSGDLVEDCEDGNVSSENVLRLLENRYNADCIYSHIGMSLSNKTNLFLQNINLNRANSCRTQSFQAYQEVIFR